MSQPLQGKVAVVTGASKGIGVAIARRLHEEGASVVLLARTVERLRALAGELGERGLAVGCDVGDPDSVRSAFEAVEARFGRVDVLVNNAAIIGMGLLEEITDEEILGQVHANLLGPIFCTRSAIPLLRRAGGGHVVNISSRSVDLARPHLSVYSATKGGVEVLSRTLAAELRPLGIQVTCVRVGPVASEPDVRAAGQGTAEVTKDWVARGGPAPEPPAPAESVADAVVFAATARPGSRVLVLHLDPA